MSARPEDLDADDEVVIVPLAELAKLSDDELRRRGFCGERGCLYIGGHLTASIPGVYCSRHTWER